MAGIRDFKKVSGSDELSRLQEKLQEFFVPIIQCALIDGTLLQNIKLESGVNSIQHKLNRELQGYIIVRKSANEQVWEANRNLPNKFLNLQSTGSVTVDLWVF